MNRAYSKVHQRITPNYLTSIIVVLLIILNSKTVFFGLMYGSKTKMALIATVAIMIGWKLIQERKIYLNMRAVFEGIILLFLLLISDILNSTNFSGFSAFYTPFILSILIVSYIDAESFKNAYSDIMVGIALISLVCFIIMNFFPSMIGKLAHLMRTSDGSQYLISPYFTWGWLEPFSRNAGMFWEPGAFQGFLNLAIIITLAQPSKRNRFSFFILLLALITTFSTTGYIIAVCICLAFSKQVEAYISLKNFQVGAAGKAILWVFLLLIVVFGVLESGVITDKLTASNGSYTARVNDTASSINLMLKNFFFGMGNTNKLQMLMWNLRIGSNSNGLFAMIYTFGGVFTVAYWAFLVKGVNVLFSESSVVKKVTIVFSLVLIFMTESVYWLQLYCVLLFAAWFRKGEIIENSKDSLYPY